MGIKGNRKAVQANKYEEPALGVPDWEKPRKTPKKTTPENSEHRRLCELGARFLHKGPTGSFKLQKCPFVAIELVTTIQEIPDIFGWDYWSTTLIEVKVSRTDFLNDSKKPFRQHPEQGIGMKRLYLCPEGLIALKEIPERWGLLYENKGKITLVKEPELFETRDSASEALLYASVFRRCGIRPQIFDFRNRQPSVRYTPKQDEMLLKWNQGSPPEPGQYMITVEADGIRFISKDWWDGQSWDNNEKTKIKAWISRKDLKPFNL